MTNLALGLLTRIGMLFFPSLFSRQRRPLMECRGVAHKGAFARGILAGLVLMIHGWRNDEPVFLNPPSPGFEI